MKVYQNQTVVLPLGMKIHKDHNNHHFRLYIDDNVFKGISRKKSLKIGNAIRINAITENTRFDNCVIYLEGTLTDNGIEPYGKYGCMIHKH